MSTYKRVGFDEERDEILAEREYKDVKPEEDVLEPNLEGLSLVEEEIMKIHMGLSNLTAHTPQESGLIVKKYFSQTLKKNYCKKTLETFFQLAEQDYGQRVADKFKEWLNA